MLATTASPCSSAAWLSAAGPAQRRQRPGHRQAQEPGLPLDSRSRSRAASRVEALRAGRARAPPSGSTTWWATSDPTNAPARPAPTPAGPGSSSSGSRSAAPRPATPSRNLCQSATRPGWHFRGGRAIGCAHGGSGGSRRGDHRPRRRDADRRHHLAGRRVRPLGDHRPERGRQDHAAAGRLGARSIPPAASPACSGEVLGTVDVFELRPRIGLTSAALAERIPRGERVHDVVVSASYAVVGRWREELRRARPRAGRRAAGPAADRPPGRPHVRHAQRGGAQAGADRPGADDRPRAAAAGRAGGRARPGRPRVAGPHPRRTGPGPVRARRRCWSPTMSRRSRSASPTPCC